MVPAPTQSGRQGSPAHVSSPPLDIGVSADRSLARARAHTHTHTHTHTHNQRVRLQDRNCINLHKIAYALLQEFSLCLF